MPFATHVSCTIEMASTTTEYEVAVIDEIQMIADGQRGQIWTAVGLGRMLESIVGLIWLANRLEVVYQRRSKLARLGV